MSFLNPLLWLGLLAVAAPLWLHLRRKTPKNLVRFSALRFLDDEPAARLSPLRLRDLLLFALRALALLLIVAAFAWPFLRARETVVVKESRVYVLDNTLSHQAGDGFAQARDRIVAELAAAARETQIAVVELTDTPRVVVAFGDDPEAARQKAASLQPSFQRGSYLAALRQAQALLANSLGERRRIVLLADSQENQWREHLNVPPFLEETEIELPKLAITNRPNLALAEPRAQRVFLGDKSIVNFSAQLAHQGGVQSAAVTVRANDRVIFTREVSLKDQPEIVALQTQWEADPAQAVRGEAVVTGAPDALAADNQVFFALPAVQEGRLALLARSPYLRLALSSEVMRGTWVARVLDPTRLADELARGADADVLVIEGGYLQAPDARALLWRYLSNGRGALLALDRMTPLIAGYLRDLGFEAMPAPADAPPMRFRHVFGQHPVFHPFESPEYGNLFEVTVRPAARLRSASAVPLVFAESGEAVFFQALKTPGRLFVAAFGFDREQTSWPLHPTFIPFLDLCLQNARAEDAVPVNFEPGEALALTLPGGAAAGEAVLRAGDKELLRAPIEDGKLRVRVPELPGVYTVSYQTDREMERVFSVNPSPKESQLTYLPAAEVLDAWRRGEGPRAEGRGAGVAARPSTLDPRPSLSAILQQRHWWWLLLAGLGALAVETLWSAARRQPA